MVSKATEYPLEPIDAVITWVDGSTVRHQQKRQTYMAMESLPLHENASNPHRWMCNDEILYCVQSIENHAPWIGKIWIVVDDIGPDLSRLSKHIRDKVHIAYHSHIFDGFTQVLPTFNSLTIESMMWRIEGLSERFLYFNDDVFLTAPLSPTDVFDGLMPIFRGKWVDFSAVLSDADARHDPAKFHHFMQINAANMMNYPATELFSSAHVVHPFRRSKMAELFAQYPEYFVNNIHYRFRNLAQFLPQGLHNHACIRDNEAKITTTHDHLHISSGQGKGQPAAETLALLTRATDPDIKFLCVNDLPQLTEIIPDANQWIAQAIGGFPEQTIEQQLHFLREIDRLKSVVRKSPLIDQSRRENSAEHSWHLAMYALILKDSSDTVINIERVIKMLLIHDIVEIDAGDHPIHETTDNSAQEKAEQQAAERIFGLLPTSQGDELKALWYEFEAAESNDAVFAKSLDRLQPLIHNLATKGGTWVEGKVNHEQVKQRYGSVISAGSQAMWQVVKTCVSKHFQPK